MRITYSLASIARAIWSNTFVPLASRTVYSVNQGVTVTTNNDKTGYTLTAGSYALINSKQAGTVAFTNGGSNTPTAAISNITTTKTSLGNLGFSSDGVIYIRITLGSTTVTATRDNAQNGVNATQEFEVVEFTG